MNEPRNMFPEGTVMRRVIDYATTQFFEKGIRVVTMDDISKGLQMSKRTLYQLFADKEQLIIACIEVIAEKERELARRLIAENRNILETILCIIENRLKVISTISHRYSTDQDRYTSVMEYLEILRQEAITQGVEFLQQGVEEGFFRDDINLELIMHCLFFRQSAVSKREEFEKFTIAERFINVGLIHLRGCCTQKGIELIDRFLDHYRDKGLIGTNQNK